MKENITKNIKNNNTGEKKEMIKKIGEVIRTSKRDGRETRRTKEIGRRDEKKEWNNDKSKANNYDPYML